MRAVGALSDAKKAHDALESAYHPCVDFEGGTALAEKEIKKTIKAIALYRFLLPEGSNGIPARRREWKGAILSRERMAPLDPPERKGAPPLDPDIAGLQLE